MFQKTHVRYRRTLDGQIYNFKYEKIKYFSNLCIYCCDLATVYDHVPPISLAYQYDGHFIIVPSCRDCNAFLNNKPIITLSERRKEIVRRIYKRRRKILETPYWRDEELNRITGWVNKYIKNFLIKKKQLLIKIKCLESNMEEEFEDCIKDFRGIHEKT